MKDWTATTVGQAVSLLKLRLSARQQDALRDMGWDDLPVLEARMGVRVRWVFSLGDGNHPLLADCAAQIGLEPGERLDANGAAQHIIEQLWLALQAEDTA